MLYLRLLGGVCLEKDDEVLSGRATQRRLLAVLALLAAAPDRSLSRDKLMGVLWPERHSGQARHNLAQAIHEIRKELGSEVLLSRGDDVALNPAVIRTDVAEFEEALDADEPERAAALYRGPFLDGFFLGGSAVFEHRIDAARQGYAARYRRTLEQLADLREKAGDQLGAVDAWRNLAAADRLNTRVAIGLMKALAAAGNPAGALKFAGVHEALLRHELGTAPGPEFGRIVEDLNSAPEAPGVPERTATRASTSGGRRQERSSRGAAQNGPESPRRATDAPGRTVAGPRSRRHVVFVIAAAVVVVATGAGIGWVLRQGPGHAAGEASHGVRPEEAAAMRWAAVPRASLAVLPFELAGPVTPEGEALAEELHEDLTGRLGRISQLRVVPRATVLAWVAESTPIAEIARELRVEYVVATQVQQTPGRLTLNVRLIDATADRPLWEATYNRPFDPTSVFELQAEVATAIAGALEARLLPAEADRISAAPTGNFAAWQLERDARLLTLSAEENAAAVRMLRSAVSLDPTYAEAHTHLGFRYWFRGTVDPRWTDSAYASIERALELDPMQPRALRWKGTVLAEQGRYAEARTVNQNLLAVQRDATTATGFCTMVEARTGRLADAAYWCHLGALEDPFSPYSWYGLSVVNILLRRPGAARVYTEKVREYDPGHGLLAYTLPMVAGPHAPETERLLALLETANPEGGGTWHARAQVAYLAEDYEGVLAAARGFEKLHPDGDLLLGPVQHLIGVALVLAGRPEEGRPHLEQGLKRSMELLRSGHEGPMPAASAAQALLLLGRDDDALEWFVQAGERGYDWRHTESWGYPDPLLERFSRKPGVAEHLARWDRRLERLQAEADARVAGLPALHLAGTLRQEEPRQRSSPLPVPPHESVALAPDRKAP